MQRKLKKLSGKTQLNSTVLNDSNLLDEAVDDDVLAAAADDDDDDVFLKMRSVLTYN